MLVWPITPEIVVVAIVVDPVPVPWLLVWPLTPEVMVVAVAVDPVSVP